MKKLTLLSLLSTSIFSTAAFAHHPAADIVDPEIYAMIDERVADTPHADLTFEDMGENDISPEMASGDAMVDMDDQISMDSEVDTMIMLEDMGVISMGGVELSR